MKLKTMQEQIQQWAEVTGAAKPKRKQKRRRKSPPNSENRSLSGIYNI